MYIESNTGLLIGAPYFHSPYQSSRNHAVINLLVIHNISLPVGEFGNGVVNDLFTGQLDVTQHASFDTLKNLQVSAHLFIDRAGEITQYVPFLKKAWHAGVSEFQGRAQCNDFSIGIELEGCDDVPYDMAQYDSLAAATTLLIKEYPEITWDRIVGHSDIAPSRKTDPGKAFNWPHYRCILRELIA